MNLYCTSVRAMCPITGDLRTFAGPNVPGISFEDARAYCNRNYLSFLSIDGALVSEIPVKEGTTCDADWDKEVSYENKAELN